jgi:hypothetical protein
MKTLSSKKENLKNINDHIKNPNACHVSRGGLIIQPRVAESARLPWVNIIPNKFSLSPPNGERD